MPQFKQSGRGREREREKENSLFLHILVLFRPSTDGMMVTSIEGGSLLFTKYGKCQISTKKILEQIHEFRKVVGYRIHKQKLVVLLYPNME